MYKSMTKKELLLEIGSIGSQSYAAISSYARHKGKSLKTKDDVFNYLDSFSRTEGFLGSFEYAKMIQKMDSDLAWQGTLEFLVHLSKSGRYSELEKMGKRIQEAARKGNKGIGTPLVYLTPYGGKVKIPLTYQGSLKTNDRICNGLKKDEEPSIEKWSKEDRKLWVASEQSRTEKQQDRSKPDATLVNKAKDANLTAQSINETQGLDNIEVIKSLVKKMEHKAKESLARELLACDKDLGAFLRNMIAKEAAITRKEEIRAKRKARSQASQKKGNRGLAAMQSTAEKRAKEIESDKANEKKGGKVLYNGRVVSKK